MAKYHIYTDGSSRGNPGKGGWGMVVMNEEDTEIIFLESSSEDNVTNNRMELMAAIAGLSALKEPCRVTLYSDSKYLVDAFLLGWVYGWRERGWKRGKDELKNPDLWERLFNLTRTHEVEFVWGKGHAGHAYNERCDALATAYADSFV